MYIYIYIYITYTHTHTKRTRDSSVSIAKVYEVGLGTRGTGIRFSEGTIDLYVFPSDGLWGSSSLLSDKPQELLPRG
jgi:hypothetical protein